MNMKWKLIWNNEDLIFEIKLINSIYADSSKPYTIPMRPSKPGIQLFFTSWDATNEARRSMLDQIKDLGFKQQVSGYKDHIVIEVKKREFYVYFKCAATKEAFERNTNGFINCYHISNGGEIFDADKYTKSILR